MDNQATPTGLTDQWSAPTGAGTFVTFSFRRFHLRLLTVSRFAGRKLPLILAPIPPGPLLKEEGNCRANSPPWQGGGGVVVVENQAVRHPRVSSMLPPPRLPSGHRLGGAQCCL